MNTQTYYVYKPDELTNKLDQLTGPNNNVEHFFKNFLFEEITNQQAAKGNSTHVFNKIIKEDTTKAKIIGHLNKLSQHNLSKVVNSIREIIFQTNDELNELAVKIYKNHLKTVRIVVFH